MTLIFYGLSDETNIVLNRLINEVAAIFDTGAGQPTLKHIQGEKYSLEIFGVLDVVHFIISETNVCLVHQGNGKKTCYQDDPDYFFKEVIKFIEYFRSQN